jgi:hypothetical protein
MSKQHISAGSHIGYECGHAPQCQDISLLVIACSASKPDMSWASRTFGNISSLSNKHQVLQRTQSQCHPYQHFNYDKGDSLLTSAEQRASLAFSWVALW